MGTPGYISTDDGGQRLADMYVNGQPRLYDLECSCYNNCTESANFNPSLLSDFGFACYFGSYDIVTFVSPITYCLPVLGSFRDRRLNRLIVLTWQAQKRHIS